MDYFAYASNLSKQQMHQRCPDARAKFQAVLPNYRLIFTGWSREWKGATASIQPVRGERVQGGVYEISEQCLRRLDRFEDYPTTYDRINVLVLDDSGRADQSRDLHQEAAIGRGQAFAGVRGCHPTRLPRLGNRVIGFHLRM